MLRHEADRNQETEELNIFTRPGLAGQHKGTGLREISVSECGLDVMGPALE